MNAFATDGGAYFTLDVIPKEFNCNQNANFELRLPASLERNRSKWLVTGHRSRRPGGGFCRTCWAGLSIRSMKRIKFIGEFFSDRGGHGKRRVTYDEPGEQFCLTESCEVKQDFFFFLKKCLLTD